MPETCASAVIPADAASVWRLVRNFDGLPYWHPAIAHSALGDGDARDRVGSVRTLRLGDGSTVVETLLSLDDQRRATTYEIIESPFAIRGYRSTIQVSPLTTTGESFVMWSVGFDCEAHDAEHLVALFRDDVFTVGLRGLTGYFARTT
ncbi:SRPBCC family protein [Streptomyces sp. NPDC057654]|uniref:SRPBCC family protein n=1 Tax=Streptomyces sp. NPDC057654 TaxID=3346196 RepID=UPI0036A4AAE3